MEGTGKINLSKKDQHIISPSPEEKMMSNLKIHKLGEWTPGKRFLVADEKFRLIIDGSSEKAPFMGDTIFFESVSQKSGIDGNNRISINFKIRDCSFSYSVDKSIEDANENLTVADIPMLIDLDQVDDISKELVGKPVWTKSALWYGDNLEYKKGYKYYAVTIVEVCPGNAFFPINVKFTDPNGLSGRFLINAGSAGNDSRSFGKLFSLSDPKANYKNISEEHWKAIQREEVAFGMNKEECRLSLGNPSDVDTGHSYSNALEIWYYPDGRQLRFVDGLLVGGRGNN